MIFDLRNIKMAKSRNGYSLSASFFIDDVEVADFEDKGDGGEPTFYINLNEPAVKLFTKWEAELEKLPELYIPMYDMNMKIDKGFFIDMLHTALVNKNDFKLLAA